MKLKSKKIIVLLILQLVCIFAFAGCVGTYSPYIIDNLKIHNIDTNLLNDYEIVCDIKGETFTGRAPSYGVMIFENEPTNFLQSFSTDKSDGFSSDKNEEIENIIDANFSYLKIQSEYCPNWEAEYKWFVPDEFDQSHRSDILLMIYFPNDLKLIVCETGH